VRNNIVIIIIIIIATTTATMIVYLNFMPELTGNSDTDLTRKQIYIHGFTT
jgi:hypothetical protein